MSLAHPPTELNDKMDKAHPTVVIRSTLDPELRAKATAYWRENLHSSWNQHPLLPHSGHRSEGEELYAVAQVNDEVVFFGRIHLRPVIAGMAGIAGYEAVCWRGPVFHDMEVGLDCIEQVRRALSETNVAAFRISPYWLFPEAQSLETRLGTLGFRQPRAFHPYGRRSTGIVEIVASEELIKNQFRKKTRYHISHAARLGIEVRSVRSFTEHQAAFSSFAKRDQRRGLLGVNSAGAAKLWQHLQDVPDLGTLIVAVHNDVFLGAILVMRGGRAGFASKLVITDEGTHMFPTLRLSPTLFYHAMLWAKGKGCDMFDLEGYFASDESVPSDFRNVQLYKSGFNPTPRQVLGQHAYVFKPVRYSLQSFWALADRWARLPRRISHKLKFLVRPSVHA